MIIAALVTAGILKIAWSVYTQLQIRQQRREIAHVRAHAKELEDMYITLCRQDAALQSGIIFLAEKVAEKHAEAINYINHVAEGHNLLSIPENQLPHA